MQTQGVGWGGVGVWGAGAGYLHDEDLLVTWRGLGQL